MRAVAAAILLLAVSLSGCASDAPEGEPDRTPVPGADERPQGNTTLGGGGSGSTGGGSNGGEGDNNQTGGEGGSGDNNSAPPVDHGPWPPVEQAGIRPGARIVSEMGQCTSNFLFRTPDNSTLLLGLAAHCVAESDDTKNGCEREPLPLGTELDVDGASRPGTLVYSSWVTMQAVGERNEDACDNNDFALVAIHPDDRANVHPAMIGFGGPTGSVQGAGAGTRVITFGNTDLRPGPQQLDEREGYVLTTQDDGWTHIIYTGTPGVQGDSGSGVMVAGDGTALGVLVTIVVAPYPGSNGVTNLEKAVQYAGSQAGVEVELVTWDQFGSGSLP